MSVAMVSMLRRHALERPGSCALTVDERRLTFAELETFSEAAAHLYTDAGVRAGDRVAIVLPNSIEFVVAAFATLKLGATVFPLSHRMPPAELNKLIELADPKVIVALEDLGTTRVVIPGDLRAIDPLAQPLPLVVSRHWKLTTSGGSTGVPKLIVTTTPAEIDEQAPPDYLLPTNETVLIPGPLYHSAPFAISLLSIVHGNHTILCARFDASQTLRALTEFKASYVLLVPTMMHRISRLPLVEREQCDVSCVTTILHMASRCPEWLKDDWIKWFGPQRIFELYGASDSPGNTLISGTEWLSHRGSVGRPRLGEFAILDPHGERLPAGQVGEIWVRPPAGSVSRAHVVGAPLPSPGGWTTVGDLGWMDADGYLYISDRREDMLVTGGENVYAAEVECALDEHPDVISSAVIGIPDEALGHRLHAIIQVQRGTTEARLRDHLAGLLVRYKIPRSFELVDFPLRDDAGKVRKSLLVSARSGRGPTDEAERD